MCINRQFSYINTYVSSYNNNKCCKKQNKNEKYVEHKNWTLYFDKSRGPEAAAFFYKGKHGSA